MISMLSRRILLVATATLLWAFPGDREATAQEWRQRRPAPPAESRRPPATRPTMPEPTPTASETPRPRTILVEPYETRPAQATATCPDRSKVILKADPAYDEYRWFRGDFATTLERQKLRLRGVEMTEWANCSEIEIGPGEWYVVMSKDPVERNGRMVRPADAIIPFKVTSHKKPQFNMAGVPPGQIRPRSEVVMTITPTGGTEYQSYRLFELDNPLQTLPGLVSPLPAKAVKSGADRLNKTKGQACSDFETRRSRPKPPSEPAAVIAYLSSRARQAKETAIRLSMEIHTLEQEIPALEEKIHDLKQKIWKLEEQDIWAIEDKEEETREEEEIWESEEEEDWEVQEDWEEEDWEIELEETLEETLKIKEGTSQDGEISTPKKLSSELDTQKENLTKAEKLLAERQLQRDKALSEKKRMEREYKFFTLYKEQATKLAQKIAPAERALFEATVRQRNDSDLQDQPIKRSGARQMSTKERREIKKFIQETEQRIASLYDGIAAFAVEEPVASPPVPIQTASAPDATIRVAPGSHTFYLVEMTDVNGCTATQRVEIDVRKLTVDFILGTQFSTYNANDISVAPEESAPGGEPGGGKEDDMMTPPTTTGITDEDRKAFDEAVVVAGIRLRHAFTAYTEGYGEIGFGGLNIEVPSSSVPASSPAPADVVRDAQVVEFEGGLRWAFMESLCDEGYLHKFLCSKISGEQVRLELNGRYGFSLLAEDQPELAQDRRGDFLDKWFFGLSVRNDNPGHLLDESFIEVGFGRSDNFADNDERFKANAQMIFDLGAIEWDFFLEGRFDADRGIGTDDLRVTIGFQREMTAFLRGLFGTPPKITPPTAP